MGEALNNVYIVNRKNDIIVSLERLRDQMFKGEPGVCFSGEISIRAQDSKLEDLPIINNRIHTAIDVSSLFGNNYLDFLDYTHELSNASTKLKAEADKCMSVYSMTMCKSGRCSKGDRESGSDNVFWEDVTPGNGDNGRDGEDPRKSLCDIQRARQAYTQAICKLRKHVIGMTVNGDARKLLGKDFNKLRRRANWIVDQLNRSRQALCINKLDRVRDIVKVWQGVDKVFPREIEDSLMDNMKIVAEHLRNNVAREIPDATIELVKSDLDHGEYVDVTVRVKTIEYLAEEASASKGNREEAEHLPQGEVTSAAGEECLCSAAREESQHSQRKKPAQPITTRAQQQPQIGRFRLRIVERNWINQLNTSVR